MNKTELIDKLLHLGSTIEICNSIQTSKKAKELAHNLLDEYLVSKPFIMKEPIRLIWQCKECKDVVISYSHLRHDMNYCECGKSTVDLEEHYQRGMGKVKEISRKKNIDGKWVNVG